MTPLPLRARLGAVGVAAALLPVALVAVTPAQAAAQLAETARGPATSYSFLGRDGRAVARWNPCKPIGYRVNARLGGAGALADVKTAVRRLRVASGLRFVYRGSTRVVPGGHRSDRYPRDTQLVIAWARPRRSRLLDNGVAGQGGAQWTSAVNRRGAADLMIVRGFAVLNASMRLQSGFGAGPRYGWQGTRGQLLMHEIGHAVGMGHADNRRQVLYPTMTRKRAVWGAGDRRGLSRLGAARGCLSSRYSSQGFSASGASWSRLE